MSALPRWRDPASTTLLLIRHGRTPHNAEQRFLGRTDASLDPIGVEQARVLATVLMGQVDALYSSPLLRALQTAAALGDAQVVPDLVELDQGDLEGLCVSEALARHPDFFRAWAADPLTADVPGGERLSSLVERTQAALDLVASDHAPGEVVGVVTHQLVIASTVCRIARVPFSQWRAQTVNNASVTAIRVQDGRGTVDGHDWCAPGVVALGGIRRSRV